MMVLKVVPGVRVAVAMRDINEEVRLHTGAAVPAR